MWRFALRFIWLALFTLNDSPGQTRIGRADSKKKAALTKPFSIEQVIVRLKDVSNKEYTEAALIKRLEKDGIDFAATPRNLQSLEDAGATKLLLDLVKRLAPLQLIRPRPPPLKFISPENWR